MVFLINKNDSESINVLDYFKMVVLVQPGINPTIIQNILDQNRHILLAEIMNAGRSYYLDLVPENHAEINPAKFIMILNDDYFMKYQQLEHEIMKTQFESAQLRKESDAKCAELNMKCAEFNVKSAEWNMKYSELRVRNLELDQKIKEVQSKIKEIQLKRKEVQSKIAQIRLARLKRKGIMAKIISMFRGLFTKEKEGHL